MNARDSIETGYFYRFLVLLFCSIVTHIGTHLRAVFILYADYIGVLLARYGHC